MSIAEQPGYKKAVPSPGTFIGSDVRGTEMGPSDALESCWTNLQISFAGAANRESAQALMAQAMDGVEGLGDVPALQTIGGRYMIDFGYVPPHLKNGKL